MLKLIPNEWRKDMSCEYFSINTRNIQEISGYTDKEAAIISISFINNEKLFFRKEEKNYELSLNSLKEFMEYLNN